MICSSHAPYTQMHAYIYIISIKNGTLATGIHVYMYAIIISGWQNVSRKYKTMGSKSRWNNYKIYRIYKHVYIHIIFITICIFALHKWIVISGVRVSHGNTVSVVGWFVVIAFDTSHVANCQCVITNSDWHNEINNLKTLCATFSFIYKTNAPVFKLNVLCH